jgi:WD40 repeat protein
MRLSTNGYVDDVEMSSTGAYIAGADIENEVAYVWDTVTGQELFEVPIFRGGTPDFGVARVDFSQDGTQLATMNPGDTASITIWELPSGNEIFTIPLPIPLYSISDYDLSPDWSQIAVGYMDGTVGVWEIETGRQLYELSAHTDWVRLSYSQNGQRLATVSGDNTAWVWEVATGEALFWVSVDYINSLSHGEFLSPDGTLLALSTGSEVYVWNLEDESLTPTSPPTTVLPGHAGWVFGITFSADGRWIAASSRNQKAWVWDPLTGEEIVRLDHGLSNAWAVAFSPDGSQLITSDWQGDVRNWDITPQGEEELRTYAIDEFVRDISPDGEKLLTGFGNTATVWEISSGEALFALEGHTGVILRPSFSPDGELLATASQDGTAIIWDADTGEPLQVLDGHDDGIVGGGVFQGVMGIAFNHDGSLVATAGADKTARIWDVTTGEELQVLTGHAMGLTNVAFSPDGRLLATSSEESDAFVRIWDVAAGKEMFSLPPVHADKVWGLAFGPNETILATGGGDTTVKLWYLDLEAGEGHVLATLIGFPGPTWFTTFSPDGRALAAGGGTVVKVWDVSSLLNFDPDGIGETLNIPELLSSPAEAGAQAGVAFNPADGTVFFSLNGTARAYTLSIDELMAIAATRVTRSLNEDECRQYLHLDACPLGPN